MPGRAGHRALPPASGLRSIPSAPPPGRWATFHHDDGDPGPGGARLNPLLFAFAQAAVPDVASPPPDAGAAVEVEDAPDAPEDLLNYSGRLVAFASISAPAGGLPAESLDPLLRVRQDGVFHPLDVRQDVATLFRAGQFAQVEAFVEPWPVVFPDGTEGEGVRVEYQVYPTPRITTLVVTGVHAMPARELLGTVGLAEGNPWIHDDVAPMEASIRSSYRARGYPAATAAITRTFDDEGDVEVRVGVEEGAAQRLVEVKVRPNDALQENEVRSLLRRAGLREGGVWTDTALRAAQDALVHRLHDLPSGLASARAWWPEARVNLKITPTEGGDRVSVLVEPRRRWTVEQERGMGRAQLPAPAELVAAMGLDGGARLGRDFAEEAGAALSDAAAQAGYLDAHFTVAVAEDDQTVRLTMHGTRGPRSLLHAVRATGETVDPDTIGAPFRGGGYGCVDLPHAVGPEGRKAALERTHADRFLCQATAESAREVLPAPPFSRQPITPEVTDRAADAIEEFFRSQGFLGVTVERRGFEAEGEGNARRRFVDVGYEVHAGPRATLEAVHVSGAVPGVQVEGLFADLVGLPVNPNTLEERARRVVDAHQEYGFLQADAEVSTVLSRDGTRATAEVTVNSGPVVLVRSVLITGQSRTHRTTIERPIDVHPGDPVSPSRLAEIRRSLYELGVFSRVSVDAVGDEDRVKDVAVTVNEKKNLSFEVGGGLATDNGVALFARAGHRNLWGLAHRLTLYGQAGVGWVGDGWSLDYLAPEWKAALRYEAPDLPAAGERVSLDVLLNETQQERSYRLSRSGGGLGVRLQVGPHLRAEFGYRAQYRTLVDIDPGVLVAGDAWADELGLGADVSGDPTLPSLGRWASGVEADFVFDARDNVQNPTKGGIGSLDLLVNDDLLSDIAFVRANGSWTQLVPLGRAGLGMLLRARGGAAISPDPAVNLPIEDRFRAGGGGSFRGFDVDQVGPANYAAAEPIAWPAALGPLVGYSARDAQGRWVTTGGDTMAVGTVELDVPFPILGLSTMSSWQLAVFSDFGNVWWLSSTVATDSMTRNQDPLLRATTGLGIRRSTPIGPLQLDLGINPAPLTYRDEPVLRVHFAVGAL